MLIKEVCTMTGLTRKAVEYYAEQGLILPAVLGNGYRDFDTADLERLRKIAVLRKLGLGTDDIGRVLSDGTGQTLPKISVQKELGLERDRAKQQLLDKLSAGMDWDAIRAALKAIEQSETITEKLLCAFPGYYGRSVCLHFARFLREPIETPEQQAAWDEIVRFLDNAPEIQFPKAVQDFFAEGTQHLSTQSITDMQRDVQRAMQTPEAFLNTHKDTLEWYLAYKQSDEYKNSAAGKVQALMKAFNSTSGYHDVFLPAMRKLSTAYAAYCAQLESANEKLLQQYPEIEGL